MKRERCDAVRTWTGFKFVYDDYLDPVPDWYKIPPIPLAGVLRNLRNCWEIPTFVVFDLPNPSYFNLEPEFNYNFVTYMEIYKKIIEICKDYKHLEPIELLKEVPKENYFAREPTFLWKPGQTKYMLWA